MWVYQKKLQYPVNIRKPDLRMAKALLAQYGGPDSELAAGIRYLNQRYSMPNDVCKSILTDIGTEELAHWEMIATMIYQCMRGATVAGIKAAGMDGFFTLHDCGLFPCDPNGVPFTTAYIACTGDPVADLTEDMAAEQKARATYEHLITLSDDPEVKKPLIFLREREVVHFQRFGEALNIVQENIASKKKMYNNMYRGKAHKNGNMYADPMNMRGGNRMYDNMSADPMYGDKMNGNMYAGGMNSDM